MIAPPANDRRGIPKKTSLTRARVKGGRILAERRAINGTMISAVQRHSNVTESHAATQQRNRELRSGQPGALLAYAHTHIHIQLYTYLFFKHIEHLVTL